MKRVLGIALVAALLTGICAMQVSALSLIDPKEREARRANLYPVAVLIYTISDARNSLLINSNVSADPKLGRYMKPGDATDKPFITVYPVSTPLDAHLPGPVAGNFTTWYEGKILGAVSILVPAGGPGNKDKADPGTYLLFMPNKEGSAAQRPLWLISIDLDFKGRVEYARKAYTTVKIGSGKAGDPDVDVSIDFLTAAVSMSWKDQSYDFKLDMDITYM